MTLNSWSSIAVQIVKVHTTINPNKTQDYDNDGVAVRWLVAATIATYGTSRAGAEKQGTEQKLETPHTEEEAPSVLGVAVKACLARLGDNVNHSRKTQRAVCQNLKGFHLSLELTLALGICRHGGCL